MHPIHQLILGEQYLSLCPSRGGCVSAWGLAAHDKHPGFDFLRPWKDTGSQAFQAASFTMLPWCNRLGTGGLKQDGTFYAIAPNRDGERYPIHGDGWQQAWQLEPLSASSARMRLQSNFFKSSPYQFDALQTFTLLDGAMHQSLSITHLGTQPMPYGLGVHPWFNHANQALVQLQCEGVFKALSGQLADDTLHPITPEWDLSEPSAVSHLTVDNTFAHWSGKASIHWPEAGIHLTLSQLNPNHHAAKSGLTSGVTPYALSPSYCHVYHPAGGDFFCIEPVSHPVNAFNQSKRLGVRVLKQVETLSMELEWRYERIAGHK